MLHLATALPHVGSTFELRYPEGPVIALRLVEAKDLGSTPKQEQFILLFQGPPRPFLPQATYGLTHPVLGELITFLVPNAQNADGFLYHAVYNRLIK
jgi:hypothetical protein